MTAKKRLTLFDRIFLWLNYALCLALLLSYLAPVTDPRKIWIIAFFGLAYPLLLLGNCVVIMYWAVRKRWYFLISFITIIIGYNVLSKNISYHTGGGSAIIPGKNIRLMSYNVHNFKRFGANNDIPTKHEILVLIKQQHPDIIGFQEYYTRKKGQYAMTDSIRTLMQTESYYVQAFQSNSDEIIGMAIFSKYPIFNQGLIRLSNENGDGTQCLYIDVKKDDHPFRVYSVHLQSIQFGRQDYRTLDTVAKIGHTDLHSIMRMGGKLKQAFLKRADQVVQIKAHAAQCPYPYIISGDFNDTPTSFAVNQISNGLKNAFVEKGFGFGRTYNGDFPNYQIDYIMATPQFDILDYYVVRKKLSDHYPVIGDLELR
jgi:endonuclease/exonuclease/phosphatase family metal-dependent hydrolase